MIEDNEESIPLNYTPLDNQIEKYFNLKNNIQTIDRTGPFGNVSLHVATRYEPNETVKLFLTNSALQLLENISYDSSSNDELKKLYLKTSKLFDSNKESQDYDYIEWSLIGDNLIKKREEFREQIDLYKTYDNQHHGITKLLLEIIEYYLNEYLIQQENFSKEQTKTLEFYFKKAIEEQSYLKYFIKAYTLTNSFHRVLNKHLALYILDYFDISTYSSSPTRYRLINCLVHIVTLLINHPDIHKYEYQGIVYRGLLMTENDLKYYTIGNHILNRSFVSTSKEREIAQIFAGNSQQSLTQVSVLLKYNIKQNQTAIDIENMSTIPDEKEVLVLPFSVFQIKDRIENLPNMCSPVLIEIDLEESQNDELINTEKTKNKSKTSSKRNILRSKNLWGSIGLCIIFTLIVVGSLIIKNRFTTQSQEGKKNNMTVVEKNQTILNPNTDDDTDTIHEQIQLMTAINLTAPAIEIIPVITTTIRELIATPPVKTISAITTTATTTTTTTTTTATTTTTTTTTTATTTTTTTTTTATTTTTTTTTTATTTTTTTTITTPASVRPPHIGPNTRWERTGKTVASGQEESNEFQSSFKPFGIEVDDDQNVVIADFSNHRVIEFYSGATSGLVVAGGNGQGRQNNQLNYPTDVCIYKKANALIICDRENRRVIRWPRRYGTNGDPIIPMVKCFGLTMDDDEFLYVSDLEKHEVRRWRIKDVQGILVIDGNDPGIWVVGGNDRGKRLDQFNEPHYIFVDHDHSVYVSDSNNHRVMKWTKGSKNGTIVAGGQGTGNALTQLFSPEGVFVDYFGSVYVADCSNHRIMRWTKGATQGSIVIGGHNYGGGANQLDQPMDISVDLDGNLYIADKNNNRVQKFNVDKRSLE